MTLPVVSPSDREIADLCLAADGLLDDQVAGATVGPTRAGHRARLRVSPALAEQAVAAGGLVIADAESVPVVELSDLSQVEDGTGDTVVLAGTARAGSGVATGIGQRLRLSRSDTSTAGNQRPDVVVLARPPLPGDIEQLADEHAGSLTIVTSISAPTPDGVPAAAMLRLAQSAAARLTARGVDARLVTATLTWRDRDSDTNLAQAVADGLGASSLTFLQAGAEDPDSPWARTLAWLDAGALPGLDSTGPELDDATRAELLRWRPPRDRRGLVVFFTGLSGAGKSTLARALADHLTETGDRTVSLLDGDEVRRMLSAGLGFGAEGRHQNVSRIGYVAAEVARHGGVAICAPIAPYERSRAVARDLVTHAGGDFVLVHVATSLADCEARDVKGLYARARSGEIAEFTGISDPYEIPIDPELRVQTAGRDVTESLADVLSHLTLGGWLPGADQPTRDRRR